MDDLTKTQIVILAGGLGTRLRPITEQVPKPLVEVGSRPYLEWQLLDLKKQGYRNILLLVSYLGQMIESYFGDGSMLGLEIKYSYEKKPMGTGGAIKNAIKQLDRNFVLLNGDSYLPLEYQKFVEFSANSNNSAVICSYDNHVPTNVPENLKVRMDQVEEYKKDAGTEDGMNFVDAGVYYLNRDIFANTDKSTFQLEELWPKLIAMQSLGAYKVHERFYDIGTLERLQNFSLFLSRENSK